MKSSLKIILIKVLLIVLSCSPANTANRKGKSCQAGSPCMDHDRIERCLKTRSEYELYKQYSGAGPQAGQEVQWQVDSESLLPCVIRFDGKLLCLGCVVKRVELDIKWKYLSTGCGRIQAISEDGGLYLQKPFDDLVEAINFSRDDKDVIELERVGTESDWLQTQSCGHTCALKKNGKLYCWGDNAKGQLGDGTFEKRTSPTAILPEMTWSIVSSNNGNTCTISSEGGLYCWGLNSLGQVGDGTKTGKIVPTRIGTDSDWSFVNVGAFNTCAIKKDGRMYCWGQDRLKNESHPDAGTKLSPEQVGSDSDWLKVDSLEHHSCAVKTDGRMFCWGLNTNGQLGDGTTKNSHAPVQIAGHSDWNDVAVGADKTCAIENDGKLYCWGLIYCAAVCGKYLLPEYMMQL